MTSDEIYAMVKRVEEENPDLLLKLMCRTKRQLCIEIFILMGRLAKMREKGSMLRETNERLKASVHVYE